MSGIAARTDPMNCIAFVARMQRSDSVPANAGPCGEANVSEANVKGGFAARRSQIRGGPGRRSVRFN